MHTAVVAAVYADPGPCEVCGEDSWRVERPGPVAGAASWLRTGGAWRPSRQVCGSCGAPGSSTGWLVRWDDEARSHLTLPARVLRGLLRTIAAQRTAVPAPWLYPASAAGGASVGAAAAVVSRSGRPARASAVGAAAGVLTCWCVFAATVLRRPSTWFQLRAAALQEVAPRRATQLRAARQDAVARSVAFPAYGLAQWDGPRALAGHSTEGDPPRVTSVELGHGEVSAWTGPWVLVGTAEHRRAEQHTDAVLADALWSDALQARSADPAGLSEAEFLVHVRATWRAREARPEPRWHDCELPLDGHRVPARWASDGEHWVAHLLHGESSVSVRACGVPLEDVSLAAVPDLDAYASWS